MHRKTAFCALTAVYKPDRSEHEAEERGRVKRMAGLMNQKRTEPYVFANLYLYIVYVCDGEPIWFAYYI